MKEEEQDLYPAATCESFSSDQIAEGFKSMEEKGRTLTKDKEGVIFLTEEAIAEGFKAQIEHRLQQASGRNISSFELSVSIIIESKDDIYNLRKYLESNLMPQNASRTLVLVFSNTNPGRKTKKELLGLLGALKRKYMVLDEKSIQDKVNLRGQKRKSTSAYCEVMEEEIGEAIKIDEIRQSVNKTSIDKNFFNILESADNIASSISTGFSNLDKALGCGGLRGGRLYAIGAISSLGKTTFVMNIADNIASSGKNVLVFSLEMSQLELVTKSLSRIMFQMDKSGGCRFSKTAIEIIDFVRGDEWQKESLDIYKDAKYSYYEKYAKHMHISEGSGDIGVEQIKASLENHQRLGHVPQVIIIDYLQILHPYGESGDRFTDKQNMDKNISELKRISRDFNLAVIVISSLNRASYLAEVNFESFKESGSIEYSCDVVMGLQFKIPGGMEEEPLTVEKKQRREAIKKAKSEYPRKVELRILKNRMYKAWNKISFKYYMKYDCFKEVEDVS
jgi:replicative DNA helicase